ETFASVFDSSVSIVDSASTTATAAGELLKTLHIGNQQEVGGDLKLLATDGATRFARVGGQFLGEDLVTDDVTLVDL
ncbi:MAG: glutamate racemase, partial [Gammaproteobacteria bacterium]|nr:glutamate racemase [Gammaproteobacteria bacterium]